MYTLTVLEQDFTVCKLPHPVEGHCPPPFWLAHTESECSLVCQSAAVPPSATAREEGWRALRIDGTLDFSLTGVLAPIAVLLAEAHVSIVALSTFDTDYFLVRRHSLETACGLLADAGYHICRQATPGR